MQISHLDTNKITQTQYTENENSIDTHIITCTSQLMIIVSIIGSIHDVDLNYNLLSQQTSLLRCTISF